MPANDLFQRACQVWHWEARSIQRLGEIIDAETFVKVIELLHECKTAGGRVLFSGKGTAGAAARKTSYGLSCVDIPAFFVAPGEGIHATSGLIQPKDLVILFSKGGNTPEILEFLEIAHNKKARVVAVTANPASLLAIKADFMFIVTVERKADDHNALATNSTIAMIAAFDAIAVALRDY
ncbi:MAG: SIS domain-containing protein [Eubacteriales bacterium]|nr:SIS domain-containing protein [Eubacteriales bacterium]